jgi:hypothetical protein
MAELTFSVRPRKPSDLILKMMPNSEKGRKWGDDGDSLIAFSKADPALSTIWDIYGLNDFIIKRWIKTLTRTGASQEINGFNSVGAALLDVKCLDFLANQQMNPKYNDLRNQSMYISGEILKFVSGEIRGFKDGQLFNERGDPASVKDPPTPIIIEDDN